VFFTPTQPATSVIGVELRGTGLGLSVIFTLAVAFGAGAGAGAGDGVGEGDGDAVADGEVGEDDVAPPHVALTSVARQMTTSNAADLVDFIDIGTLPEQISVTRANQSCDPALRKT
jgi:hypothetical protein